MLMTDTMTMSRSPPTYTFGDETSSSPGPPGGRKHRRGRGYTPPGAAKSNSYRQGGQNHSPAAARASHGRSSSPGNQRQHHQTQPQAIYSFSAGDAWNTPPPKPNNGNGNDDNSLTYSASSSVQSAESGNSASFAEIFKVMGGDEEGQMKEFMAKQTKAACVSEGGAVLGVGNGESGKTKGMDSGIAPDNDAAVAGWIQRNQAQHQQHQPKENTAGTRQQHSSPVDWNYSKDSSEDDMLDVNFTEHEENVLETIAGKLDEGNVVAHRITVTSQSPAEDDLLFADDPFASNNYSRDVTPPPNARRRRASTPPGSISRTNSRHSKSSSDESWDTPTASSPPHGGAPGASKPPARGAKAGRRRSEEEKGGDLVEEALKEAFYTKSWMCGFTDAFNFDGFDTFQK